MGDFLVYGLVGAMLGVVVWWVLDAWVAAKRRRLAAKKAIDDRKPPPTST